MNHAVVTTRAGVLRGAEIADGVIAWKGVPYAAPPVGGLRWRPPRPASAWAGVRDALEFGPGAPQPTLPTGPRPDVPGMVAPAALPPDDESCLVLNVTAPAGAHGLPVVVWIHGGGFQVGNGTQGAGDGSAFAAAHHVVVVTVNHRLGALGFLALPDEPGGGSFGVHDQIAALAWVRDNIAAFGGDPARVTLSGVSAGAKAVATVLASPLARGLIAAAASYSGGADHVSTPDLDARVLARMLALLGMPGASADRLREVPAAEILAAQTALAPPMRATWIWRPSLDGTVVPRLPLAAIADGAAAGIPLLVQHCRLEGLIYDLVLPGTAEEADRVLAEGLGEAGARAVLEGYADSDPRLAADRHALRLEVFSDERYGVPSSRLADAQSRHAPVWRSRYDGPLPGLPVPGAPAGPLPATHATDVGGVWFGLGPAGAELSAAAGAFVRAHDPGAAGHPDWSSYEPPRRATMVVDSRGSRQEDDPDGPRRRAWGDRTWPASTWWSIGGLD